MGEDFCELERPSVGRDDSELVQSSVGGDICELGGPQWEEMTLT